MTEIKEKRAGTGLGRSKGSGSGLGTRGQVQVGELTAMNGRNLLCDNVTLNSAGINFRSRSAVVFVGHPADEYRALSRVM